jgi:hypothetical protein
MADVDQLRDAALSAAGGAQGESPTADRSVPVPEVPPDKRATWRRPPRQASMQASGGRRRRAGTAFGDRVEEVVVADLSKDPRRDC